MDPQHVPESKEPAVWRAVAIALIVIAVAAALYLLRPNSSATGYIPTVTTPDSVNPIVPTIIHWKIDGKVNAEDTVTLTAFVDENCLRQWNEVEPQSTTVSVPDDGSNQAQVQIDTPVNSVPDGKVLYFKACGAQSYACTAPIKITFQ